MPAGREKGRVINLTFLEHDSDATYQTQILYPSWVLITPVLKSRLTILSKNRHGAGFNKNKLNLKPKIEAEAKKNWNKNHQQQTATSEALARFCGRDPLVSTGSKNILPLLHN